MVFWLFLALLVAFFAWASWVIRRRNQTPAWRDAPNNPTIGGRGAETAHDGEARHLLGADTRRRL